ncbi:HlyD family type I secretion periplasmic adaptor subunit [Chitinimonas sp. BJB300]|uniref:HlyD family type I secretion periplasmic adaptor subunit n=1 Tax=Chitinimonas sp. BJB300 TaxID=1559339 RepID=UPI000C1197F6|nr:HlyD family type I secretion periplasmic adaptor subunit [Chitinimonas sp. BJB300]PHV11385.1 secretion protein HylD [Chitinimonas sp. BJB300]TSJ88896.1 HlyD family type I secretion periplasmic adaptor subunit [Chitinimonas sp. BJB300]
MNRQAWIQRWRSVYGVCSTWMDKAMAAVAPNQSSDDDFDSNADWAIAEQTPRGARNLVWISAVAVLVLLIWAGLAPIDEVTRGEGKVIPSRQVQVLQSLDGGMVSEIRVREGQSVKAGDLLLKVDPTRMMSSLRENQVQYLALLAKAARLKALADGKLFVAPPEVAQQVPELAEQERMLYESRRAELEAGVGVARQQMMQRSQELNSLRAKRETASRSYDLTAHELVLTRPLAKTGAVSEVELLRLERDVSRYRGERDSANADIPRIQAAISEAGRKIQEVELAFKNQARTELSEANAKLSTLSEGSLALEDRVKQTEIRSPVRGTIKQLLVNTVGGVVQPGKDLVEVVPTDDALVLEARILPKDIAFLRPGQRAQVKFSAYDFSTYGGLDATLEHISADTVTDERGNAFFLVRVRTASSSLGPQKLPIIPGMVAEVDILTGKKTILSYLLKPILRAKANSLTER